MQRFMLKSKIHRATVTGANVDYEGSVAIDGALLDEAGVLPFEKVEIYNISNGNRFETYAITAARGSGTVCINGAAAHLARKGDIVIIASYVVLSDEEAQRHEPVLVYVDEFNGVKRVSPRLVHSV